MGMMGGVISMIGGVVGAAGAMQQGEQQAAGAEFKAASEVRAHEYNIAVDKRNRAIIVDQTHAALDIQYRESERKLGAIRSRYASAGVTMTGSASDVMVDTWAELALQRSMITYQGKIKQIELTDDINRELMAAEYAKKAGAIEAEGYRTAGTISAVSSILGGLGSFANAMA
jgi:hypothetical protein